MFVVCIRYIKVFACATFGGQRLPMSWDYNRGRGKHNTLFLYLFHLYSRGSLYCTSTTYVSFTSDCISAPFRGCFFFTIQITSHQIKSRGWGELTVVEVGTVETLCFHGFHVVNGQEGQGVVLPAP